MPFPIAAFIIGSLIGGAVSAGGQIAGAAINKKLTGEANAKSEELWNIQRADELKYNKDQNKIAKMQIRQNKKAFEFNRAEAALSRGERAQGNILNNAFALINQNQATRSLFVNMFERRKAA